jgi:transposase
VRHLLAVYDVNRDHLTGQIRRRKRSREFLRFLKSIRRRYRGALWVILDNFSPHRKQEVLTWAKAHHMRLVFLPTNASWLNRIECQFTPLKKNVLTHCDDDSFQKIGRRTHRYLRWRNKRKQLLSQKRH